MLQDRIRLQPAHGHWKVYIVDEVHMLSKSASNALLKTLEEPPPHAIFVLATTELDKIPETVRSRCQTFLFRRAPASLIEERLGWVARAEGLNVSPEALRLLATAAGGCFRDAESLLATVAGSSGEEVSAAEASELLGLTPVPDVQVFCVALFARDATTALAIIQRTSERGGSFSNFTETLARYLRALASFSLAGAHAESYSPDEEAEFQRHAEVIPVRDQVALLRLALRAKYELRDVLYEELPLELLALEWCSAQSGGGEEAPLANGSTQARKQAELVAHETPTEAPAAPREAVTANTVARHDGSAATFEGILRVWPKFLRAASALHTLLLPMLHSAVPLAVRENTLFVLSNHALAHDRLKDATFRHPLEQKLEEITGTSLRFRLVRDGELLTLGLTERAADMRSRIAAMLGALQEQPADSSIADTLSIFGGEVVDGGAGAPYSGIPAARSGVV